MLDGNSCLCNIVGGQLRKESRGEVNEEMGGGGGGRKGRAKEGDPGSAEGFPSKCNCLQMLMQGEGTNVWSVDSEGGTENLAH